MDILTHTLSGIAVGTFVSSFSKKDAVTRFGIIIVSGIGGALPDLDAISLWSKFDTTIGKTFGLDHSGQEIYFSKFWYSHHAFLHSVFAALLITLLIGILSYLFSAEHYKKNFPSYIQNLRKQKLLLVGFCSGFVIHLFEDMPTPHSVWGGVNFFWPSKSYIGGTGDIWWWNNYDIFLIVVAVIIFNTIILISGRLIKADLWKLTLTVFILGFAFCLFQIKTRAYDFNYTGHTDRYQELEAQSKALQKQILGRPLYNFMVGVDNKIPFYF